MVYTKNLIQYFHRLFSLLCSLIEAVEIFNPLSDFFHSTEYNSQVSVDVMVIGSHVPLVDRSIL